MLGVLANILGWGENDREKAGLQRAGGGPSIITTGMGGRKASSSLGGGKDLELERSDETEVSTYSVSFRVYSNFGCSHSPICGSSSSLKRPARAALRLRRPVQVPPQVAGSLCSALLVRPVCLDFRTFQDLDQYQEACPRLGLQVRHPNSHPSLVWL